MRRTIACGVDQSDAAEAVANTARWLANRRKARLVLVHVAEEPAGKTEAVLARVRVPFGFGSRDDVRLVDGSPVASWPRHLP
jgi:nucleotide-binding universal stress UspA family protein